MVEKENPHVLFVKYTHDVAGFVPFSSTRSQVNLSLVQLRHQLSKMKAPLARRPRKTMCFTCAISRLFQEIITLFTAHYVLRNKVMTQKPCHGRMLEDTAERKHGNQEKRCHWLQQQCQQSQKMQWSIC